MQHTGTRDSLQGARRRWFSAAALMVCLLSLSCEEAFDPKMPAPQQYVLTCILRNDTTTQVALLTRTYNVDGLDPAISTDDKSVRGAVIVLRSSFGPDTMKEYSIDRTDTSRYTCPLTYYAGRRLTVMDMDTVHIEARMPDGTVLSAGTRIPAALQLHQYPELPSGMRGDAPAATYGTSWTLEWSDNAHPGEVYFPRLVVDYIYRSEHGPQRMLKEIPIKVVMQGKKAVPAFIQYTTNTELEYDFAAIDYAMRGVIDRTRDTVKKHYSVNCIRLKMITLDPAAAAFFASVNGYLDPYSIRTDQIVYSNIGGGRGVFGIRYYREYEFPVDPNYIAKLGYQQ